MTVMLTNPMRFEFLTAQEEAILRKSRPNLDEHYEEDQHQIGRE